MAMRELNPAVAPGVDVSQRLYRQCHVPPLGRLRDLEQSFKGSGKCHCSLASWRQEASQTSAATSLAQRRIVEKLWREFFSDPSQWWDNRPGKENDRYPDFKHKETQRVLWLDGKFNPRWVEAELATIVSGNLHSDLFTWNRRLAKYVKDGHYEKTIEVFRQMQQENMSLNSYSFVPVLKACACLQARREGRRIHKQIIVTGLEAHVHVGSGLVDMYAKCGRIEDARRVFDKLQIVDVVCWSAMILGYAKCGQGRTALELSQKMLKEGVEPNHVTFVGLLRACTSLGDLKEGRRIHEHIIRNGCESDSFVGSCLVDMYAKCGVIEEAWSVFEKMPKRNVVAWTAMILGYVKCGHGQKALELSWQMQWEGVEPNHVTFVGMLNACASVGALDEGRRVHAQIVHSGCESNVFVGNSLIDMYAKCGSLDDATRMFTKMPIRNVVSWTSMLGGYAMHGQAKEALGHFERMCQEGVEMNEVTFVVLLSICNRARLVDEGLRYFELMLSIYHIYPTKYHYACMFELLGRVGRLEEAEDVIKKMSAEPSRHVWKSLLHACKVYGNVEMRKRIAEGLPESDSGNAAGSVLESNQFSDVDTRDSGVQMQEQRSEKGVKKESGSTWIEVNNEVHSFTISDQDHPQITEIRAELTRLTWKLEERGYLTDTKSVTHDVDGGKKSIFCYHNEKLAIAFGLISTPPRTPLRIFKNLRVCKDCHTATKFMAKITDRAISVRDTNLFHHFENGLCSCKDHW